VWMPSGELAHFNGTREQHEMTDADLAVGGVRYERLAPMQSWRLTADVDRVALDLVFDALTPAVGVDGQGREGKGASAATATTVGKGHLEQAGRWTGWIDVDGTRHELVDARGNRDKSWGPRRWGGPKMGRWLPLNIAGTDATLDPGGHFGGIRIGTDSGDR